MKTTVLIIDDDVSVISSIALALKQAGYASRAASSPKEAMAVLRHERIDLVLQDMNFSRTTTGEEGLELLASIKTAFPNLPVMLMTAWASIELAVRGMQSGAADFITKPWSNDHLVRSIETLFSVSAEKQSQGLLPPVSREELDAHYDFQNIIGSDPKLLKVLAVVARVSATDAPVLIMGESGTGKELIADAIHRNSARFTKHGAPFVKVNLASVTPTLFESELFGHVKGAFTDAKTDRKGRFEAAHTGSIFLDEIGDVEMSCQVKLLRALQDRTYQPVGSSQTKTADVRVISATNRNLSEMIAAGSFREDLFYRLNLITLHVPPLRERRDDIPLLAHFFTRHAAQVYGRHDLALSAEAVKWLQRCHFAGNIRELKHLIERTALVSANATLDAADFISALDMQPNERRTTTALPDVGAMSLEDVERAMIVKALETYPNNLSRVAEVLGVTRQSLYRRCEKYGIRV